MKHVDYVEYWEEYYKKHKNPGKQSPFATFVFDFLTLPGKLLELGCGNGRDAVFFAQLSELSINAVDLSKSEIEYLNKNYSKKNLHFTAADFTKLSKSQSYEYIYSRFTLHSIDEESETRTIKWVRNALKKSGLFFIEVRSIDDELCGEGTSVGNNEFVTDHYRRFANLDTLLSKLTNVGLQPLYVKKATGLAVHKDEDPEVIRIIAQKP